MSKTYLVTGANRGLGKALVESYLSLPDSTVIATVRNPDDASSKSLKDLSKASSAALIVVKLDNTSDTDPSDAIAKLRSDYGITSLDVVIANAAIMKKYPRVEEAKPADLLEHYQVNVIGVVNLFRAVLPLLRNSKTTPKFIGMSSGAGSIEFQNHLPFANGVYAPSKAALNWFMRRIHVENEDLIAFPLHPGFVQTESGNAAAKGFGLEEATTSVEESISGLVKVIDDSTRESHSGKFVSYDGTFMPW